MPHIVVNIWPGRTDETKSILANRLAVTAAEVLEMEATYPSIRIHEVPANEWDEFLRQEYDGNPKREGEQPKPM